MALLIPPEFKKDLSERSGFLKHGTPFAEKNLKGLFMSPQNLQYLGRQLFILCTLPHHIVQVQSGTGLSKSDYDSRGRGGASKSNGAYGSGTFVDGKFAPADNFAPEAERLATQLRKYKAQIVDIVPDLIDTYGSKFYTNDFYEEDYSTNSPVQQLHHLNKKFLIDSSDTIIKSPDIVVAGYYDVNPDTGNHETGEYEYTARSYADGTWHPEDLFTNSTRNRENPPWVPREITFDSHPPRSRTRPMKNQGFSPFLQNRSTRKEQVKGLTYRHREGYDDFPEDEMPAEIEGFESEPPYGRFLVDGNMDRGDYGIPEAQPVQDPLLDDPMYGPGPGPGNQYMYDFYGEDGFSKGGLFPAWQYTPNNREYDRHNAEGLREGGSSDRRVNSARRTGYDMSDLISKSTY